MKLLKVVKSTNPKKKYMAEFLQDNGRTKTTHFGSRGMMDFTLGATKEQRERYRIRHKKDLETGDPTRAGFLSFNILWGQSTSLEANIASYKKRFNL
tara:strand:- start:873 stop:1163 length:291 start_codon:yes stop_codon:yes gene_type:complete